MRRLVLLILLTSGLAFSQGVLDLSAPRLAQRVTAHFTFDYYVIVTPALGTLADGADEVYAYVSARMDERHNGKVSVAVRPVTDGPCPARGVMLERVEGDEPRSIIIFVDGTTSPEQLRAVLAHELAHLLHAGGFAGFPSAVGLTEGLASWAAGRYWLLWQGFPSFAASVRTYLERGTYMPLEGGLELGGVYGYAGEGCLARRDVLYTEWAAFTDYLVKTHGVNRFKALLSSADVTLDGDAGTPPDFARVYGLSLEELEEAWLESLGAE